MESLFGWSPLGGEGVHESREKLFGDWFGLDLRALPAGGAHLPCRAEGSEEKKGQSPYRDFAVILVPVGCFDRTKEINA